MPDDAIEYRESGVGPTVVLAPGSCSTGSAWRPVLERLTPERDVWAVDLPGFGGSGAIADGPCGIEALADAVEAFMGASGLERPHVAGNSLGGVVALELARRGVVASATALSPAGFGTRLEGRFAVLSLRATYAIGARLRRSARTSCGKRGTSACPNGRSAEWREMSASTGCSALSRSWARSPTSSSVRTPAT